VSVRRAVSSDVVELAATLASAFSDDPWMRWTVDSQDHDLRLAQIYELMLREIALPHGVVWTTDQRDAVAIWVPTQPTAASLLVLEPFKAELRALAGDRAGAAAAAQELVGARFPRDATWYLAVTGVHSERQRRGLGSAVLGPMLERLDRDQLVAVLDTSTAGNVSFYVQHGFGVADELDLPEGGPHVWIMRREPAHQV
jgi:ribosomal protein S18 acetylase RimI-like enzyme